MAAVFLYPSKPEIEIKSMRIVGIGWDDGILIDLPTSLHIEMDLTVINDNVMGAVIDKVKGKAYLSDNDDPQENDFIGDFSVEKPFEVPGNGKVDITVDFYLRDLPSPVKTAKIIDSETIFLRTAGNVYLSLSFFDFSIPFDETERI